MSVYGSALDRVRPAASERSPADAIRTKFYGIVDFLAILPTYVSPALSGTRYLVVIRTLRLHWIFSAPSITYTVDPKITTSVMIAKRNTLILQALALRACARFSASPRYFTNLSTRKRFNSSAQSIYWSIVTLTTVGYGDTTPKTGISQAIASVIMICGHGIIAVPTGIVSVGMTRTEATVSTICCSECSAEGHAPDAIHCNQCGARLVTDLDPA